MTHAVRPKRLAVVVVNLGGPDGPDDVKPFLSNLFNDPAIITAPNPIRAMIAWLISTTREKEAKENYAKMGGGSPLLAETRKQTEALTQALTHRDIADESRVFIAMRHWTPFTEDALAEVTDWGADEVVFLPLYPQFSTTTTGSSLAAWRKAAGDLPTRVVCCYPTAPNFITAHAQLIRKTFIEAGSPAETRLLFSAHGLPEKIVKAGDPYQWQVEQTSAAVARAVPELVDWEICYQSRVGPLTWIGPSTEDAIDKAAEDGKTIMLTPIAFVSEHIETLVELDDEYKERAAEAGAPGYLRVPALGVHTEYVNALADLVADALGRQTGIVPPNGNRICPAMFGQCPVKQ